MQNKSNWEGVLYSHGGTKISGKRETSIVGSGNILKN